MTALHAFVRFVFVAGLTASSGLCAAEWPGGDPVEIPAGTIVENDQERGSISCITNNGSLTFLAGSGLTLTGNVVSAVGSGEGADAAFDLSGGSVTNLGNGHFVVGHCDGVGTMTIAYGATFFTHQGYFAIARNEDGMRDLQPYGEVTVAGTLIATNRLEFTGFHPTNSAPPYAMVSARLILDDDGVVEAGEITKNDCAASEIIFNGGALRAGRDNTGFIAGGGVMEMIITDGKDAIFDTAGHNVGIRSRAAPQEEYLKLRGETGVEKVGNGGLVKKGAGALAIRLPGDTCNTFTGTVTVVEGTLDLGRPLAEYQTVTVYPGATFVPYAGDAPKIIYQGTTAGDRMTYTVVEDTGALDLTMISARYFDDRLAGPFSGDPTVTLNGAVTHTAGGSALAPFLLLGNGGTLNLTNTGLDSGYLRIEGPGTFSFAGPRTYASADDGKIVIADSGYRQGGDFMLDDPSVNTPASLTCATGRFTVDGTLVVGAPGYGRFAADGATLSLNALKVGGIGQGTFSQSAGTVTIAQQSYIGVDGGTGDLTVTGGQFIVNNNLRVASNYGSTLTPAIADKGAQARGTVTVSNALLRCGDFVFTSWWVTDGSRRSFETGVLNLLSDGVAEVNTLQKNDDPISNVRFAGGTLRARTSAGAFLTVGQSGRMNLLADAGHDITIDTVDNTVASTNHSGTLAFSGKGGFRKQGTGTLLYGPDIADYEGDTVLEVGTLQSMASDRIPDGQNAGDLYVGPGAMLNLFGNDETVNRVFGSGIVASPGTPSTFGILADGSNGTWGDGVRLGGRVILDKRGEGTLTIAAKRSLPSGLTVSEGAVQLAPAGVYPSYRFKVEGVKGEITAATFNSMQIAEFALYDGDTEVTARRSRFSYDSTGGAGGNAGSNAYPVNEVPENAVNGSLSNKWLDFRIQPSRSLEDRNRVWIRFDFPVAQPITRYNWATANDTEARDPAAWRLQGSHDGETWSDLDVRTGYLAKTNRNTWAEDDGFALSPDDTLNDAGLLTVCKGASLTLGSGMSETVGGLAGDGRVTLAGADLTLAVVADRGPIFCGNVSGDGGLVKDGAGVQIMYGTNTFDGPVVVRDGILRIQDAAPFRWFKFTIKGVLDATTNATQISEFALYNINGQRQNLGLVQGGSVTTLLPGQFATPESYTGSSSEAADKLFDGAFNTKWCLTSNGPKPDTSNTWRTVVMRLADTATEVIGYNLSSANDVPVRDPTAWTLEGSVDGITWVTIDDRADVTPPATRLVYYNGGVSYELEATRAVSFGEPGGGSDAIPFGSVVEVCEGATLDVHTAERIGALRIDMLNAGTITAFNPEHGGALHIVNAPAGARSGLVLPLILDSVPDISGLKSWSVFINCEPRSGLLADVNPEGYLYLRSKGTILLLQ